MDALHKIFVEGLWETVGDLDIRWLGPVEVVHGTKYGKLMKAIYFKMNPHQNGHSYNGLDSLKGRTTS